MQIINDNLLDKERKEKLKELIEEIIQIKDIEECIQDIKGIKIIEENILHKDISASIKDGYIIIPINKIGNITENSEEINLIKSNIIHEIYHMKLKRILPKIHKKHKEAYNNEDFITSFTIVIYIEYLTHLESSKYETEKMIDQYLKSINDYNWDFSDDTSKIYLVKHAGYIIARAEDERVKNKNYILNLKNEILRKEIKKIQDILDNIKIEDNYNQLLPIENIVRKYITNE